MSTLESKLTQDVATFILKPSGFVGLVYKEVTYDRVDLMKLFPLTLEDKFISVRDMKDQEIGIIVDLESFEDSVAQGIRRFLEKRYFTPQIIQIKSLTEEYGHSYWAVETSAGSKEFVVNGHNNLVIKMRDECYQLVDTDGNRYLLPKLDEIEDKYVRIIENFI